ncbi:hypothetical protein R1flu_002310 [Riccia fluitans]|uniref:Protein kinase domain-containing protein n=1 Tax=Riccia fluitans TaxID=41844 RepID=A0ABD1Y5W8_9MARC
MRCGTTSDNQVLAKQNRGSASTPTSLIINYIRLKNSIPPWFTDVKCGKEERLPKHSLDKDYNAKIADFGLIRPARTEDTQVTSNIAGTNFGIVLLEIVSGRRWIDRTLPEAQIYLREWSFHLYKEKMLLNLLAEELKEDHNEEEVVIVLEMALACCQDDSADINL